MRISMRMRACAPPRLRALAAGWAFDRYARQGEARVPCLKLPSRAFLVARVPFSKNGAAPLEDLNGMGEQAAAAEETRQNATHTQSVVRSEQALVEEMILPSASRVTLLPSALMVTVVVPNNARL